jgi:hypothetical protein
MGDGAVATRAAMALARLMVSRADRGGRIDLVPLSSGLCAKCTLALNGTSSPLGGVAHVLF